MSEANDNKPNDSDTPESKNNSPAKDVKKAEAKQSEASPADKASEKTSEKASDTAAQKASAKKTSAEPSAQARKKASAKADDVDEDVEVNVEEEQAVSDKKAADAGKGAQKGHGHGAPVDPDQPVNADFKDNDIHLDTVRKFMFGSLGVTLVFFVLMLVMHRILSGGNVKERGVATEETRQIPRQDQSLLQTNELVDLETYVRQERERLTTPQETEDGRRTIPVELLKQRMLDEGAFPTPEPGSQEAAIAQRRAPQAAPQSSRQSQPQPERQPAAETAATPATETAAEPQVASLDPEMVDAGRKLWEIHCAAACHTGKPGAIAPNILHAFGTMRELENADPILMDDWYVKNSMINPNEHIAKGYQPVMMAFKNVLSDRQLDQVVAYLKSEGINAPPIRGEEPEAAPAPAEAVSTPAAPEAAPAPAAPAQRPAPQPAPERPAPRPEPAPAPAPAEPAQEPAPESGRPSPIFI